MACISLNDSFLAFDKNRLIQFAKYYPEDFSDIELMILDDQLQTYIMDVWVSNQFFGLKNVGDLAQKIVETKKNDVYPLVYRLVTLALILPVATATVGTVFSTMNIIKNGLRNRMGDQWMNDNYLFTLRNISSIVWKMKLLCNVFKA